MRPSPASAAACPRFGPIHRAKSTHKKRKELPSHMAFALTLSAIRRHPFGVSLTFALATVTAGLLGVYAPLALATWLVTALACFELWYVLESVALRRLGGCRCPTAAELQRIEAVLGRTHLEVLVADRSDVTAIRGLRCFVVGRDLMDILEDRALSGFLAQAVGPLHTANFAGYLVVWLGNLPVLAAWWTTRLVGQLARLLALVVGTSLVLPLVVCRDGFLRWVGLIFTCVIVALCGSVLLSYGFAAAGAGLLLAWLLVPVVQAVLGWESRRIELLADRVTVETGLGPQLREAVDFLATLGSQPPESGLLSVLSLPTPSMAERERRIRRQLATPESID